MSTSPMFTVEQIELIRRLRNSGITKEQVIQAFDTFNRLDQELGLLYSVPVTSAQPGDGGGDLHHHRLAMSTTVGPHHSLPQIVSTISLSDSASQRGVKRTRFDSEDDAVSIEDDQSNQSSSDFSTGWDPLTEELREFMKQKPEKIHTEIIDFVRKHSVKHNLLAAMTGLNVVQLHQYFSHEGYKNKTARFLTSLYSWYLAYRQAVSPISYFPSNDGQPVVPVTLTTPSKVMMMEGHEMMMPNTPKRERFTFRQRHLEILESCFKENPYPTHEQRENIAQMCNLASSDMGTRLLNEKEKVNSQMVLNWFANRRKEVKRIAREEGVDASSALLRSRLRAKTSPGQIGSQEFRGDSKEFLSLNSSSSPGDSSVLLLEVDKAEDQGDMG
ncbi:hypothetical protein ACJMK2_043364 [Sinanodonta woodiana]|uniref:Uncharacterized protein n=1 Tax=Sinanodonta woodiana TaxID=1069815 RepID=A0ABD3VZT3_SINWO